jgi:hypothetical protein
MKLQRWIGSAMLGAAFVIAAAPTYALAQKKYTDPPTPLPQGQVTPLPDPTRPNRRVQDTIDANRPVEGAIATRLPLPVLKGRVIAKGRAPSALVDIGGQSVTFIPGSVRQLNAGQTLTCVEVSATEVRLELNSPKETIHLN